MIIPVIHCFDNRYVIPAAVSFLSMLEYANKKHQYKLYVLHTDITLENQNKLTSIVSQFSNASLEFINMDNKFSELFSNTQQKAHYSKEMYYKLCIASLFPQYDFAIVTDVDVLYQGDISIEYEKFIYTTEYYAAGVHVDSLKGTFLETYSHIYDSDFSKEEKNILNEGVGAGYLILNLAKMRQNDIGRMLIDYTVQNAHRLIQPEQDVLNLCLSPQIYHLPLSSMVCTYLYDIQLQAPEVITPELEQALLKPIQVHFATHVKPWNKPSCTKSHLWYSYLLKTPFFYEQMYLLEENQKIQKEIWCFCGIPILLLKTRPKAIQKIKLFGVKLTKRKSK